MDVGLARPRSIGGSPLPSLARGGPPPHLEWMPHPSLTGDPIGIEPLTPLERMDPYLPCWCRSGTKYKWCHHRRDRQAKVDIFEAEGRMQAQLREGYCSRPVSVTDPCSATIARAHTVQRRGGLAAIAEEGHVLTVKPTMKEMVESEGRPSPRRIGVGNASVFRGFCTKHDTTLFKPIEGRTLSLDREAAFLFAYRTIAYERCAKEAQMRALEVQRDMDRGHAFWKQVMIQTHLHALRTGILVGLRDVDGWKARYDERLLDGRRDEFHYRAFRFDRVLPFVAATAFHVEFDLSGERLQRLGRDGEFEHISVSVTAYGEQMVLVLGWIGSSDGPSARFAGSFQRIPDERKTDALLQLLFVQSENIFLQPSWWHGLDSEARERLLDLVLAGTTLRGRTATDLKLADVALVPAGVVEFTGS